MDSVVAQLKFQLQQRTSDYFPELSGEYLTFDFYRMKRAAYSTVYFFRAKHQSTIGNSLGIVVKVYSDNHDWKESSKAQYAALRTVWPLFKDSQKFGLPRPLDFISHMPALVMEEVLGKSFQTMFHPVYWISPKHFKAIVNASWGCGRWLQYFHQSTALSSLRLDLEHKHHGTTDNLSRLESMGFPRDLVCKIECSLERRTHALAGVDLPAALVHGDFTVDNVLIHRDRFCALDIWAKDRNAIYHDLATFLNSISIIELTIPVPARLIRSCSQAFLSGYFGTKTYNRVALQFLRLAGLVSVALEILDRRGAEPIAGWWIRQFFGRRFNAMLDNYDN